MEWSKLIKQYFRYVSQNTKCNGLGQKRSQIDSPNQSDKLINISEKLEIKLFWNINEQI